MRILSAVVAVGLFMVTVKAVEAAGSSSSIPERHWKHGGLFGSFDRSALKRGFKVYKEVCSSCHGMRLLAYRNLVEIGFSENEVKKIASDIEVAAEPNEEGEVEDRPGLPSDRFKSPFANDNAARAGNNGALPPDLSLIVKARAGGANYIYALLNGYKEPPSDAKVPDGMNYNEAYAGQLIAMAPPLADEGIEYSDGTKATIKQQAEDVVTFLSWAAEPELEERKRLGIKVILFLLLLTGLLYVVKRRIWANAH